MNDTALLAAALKGLELQKSRIEEQINHLRSFVDGSAPQRGSKGNPPGATAGFEPAVRKRRPLSAAALKRISAAQKKRWAKYRQAGGKRRTKQPAK
jgi:hypothetical protein